MGPELMDNMRKQAEHFGAEFITDDGTRVDLTGDIKTVYVGETAYQAKAVILATGSAWRPLGVPGEQELLGHGVSSCATCDGFFFRGQDIVVVGGGDSAMEEATFLTRFASSGDDHPPPRRVPRQQDHGGARARQREDQGAWNTVITEVVGDDGKVVGVRLTRRQHRRRARHRRQRRVRRHRPRSRAANSSSTRSSWTSRGT